MLHLKTFGGLSVTVDDAPGNRAAQQRKTLALLALLSAAGKSGMSRDKLVAYLWPDADTDHARGLLKQACYALRRDLREPDLFLGTTQLRLNPDVITSDVQDFETALERRDDAQAAVLYSGPFLDGFYLGDSSEFERWVDSERDRLRQRACGALERLASDAAARGDPAGAVEWWRRLAALDRLNSRVALGLMQALAAAGDRAGALQVARVHSTLVREELGVAPDAAVAQLTNRFQAEAERAPAPRRQAAPAAPAAPAPEPATFAEVPPSSERTNEPGASATPPSRPAWKRRGVALVLVLVGLLTGGSLLFRARSAETARAPMKLVVLPFTNLGSPDDGYFADGVTEEITARLAGIGALRIIGATSASRYKNTTKAIPEIGKELGVDFVLEGSVRWQKSSRGPARVRVTPQLVNTADGTHLWAEVYDEPLDEIFRVQSEIAQHVVQALDITVLEPQRRAAEAIPTRNLQAYDYYLRGNDYMRRGTDERALRAAARVYEKAVELDSGFAQAYSWLCRVYTRIYWRYFDHSPERLAQAKRAADRSLELAPELPEPHQALAIYYGLGLQDYDRAMREYALAEARGAISVFVSQGKAAVRVRQGKIRESLADYEKASQQDPASSVVATGYGQPYDLLREYPRAVALWDRAIALAPDRLEPYLLKIWVYLRWDGNTRRARAVLREAEAAGAAGGPGVLHARVLMELFDRRYEGALALLSSEAPEIIVSDDARVVPRAQHYALVYALMRRPDLARAYYDSARRIVEKKVQADSTDPRLRTALGIAYAGLGRKQDAIQQGLKAVALMPISREAFKGYHHEWELARIYTMVGEQDLAISRLEHLLSIPGQLTAAWLRMDPVWDPLRSNPRFQKLVGGGA